MLINVIKNKNKYFQLVVFCNLVFHFQKIVQLENQIQRYTTQINTLENRLAVCETTFFSSYFLLFKFQSSEEDNEGLRNELSSIQRRTPRDTYITGDGSLPRSSNRNVQQLVRLRDLFESKSNDFNQTLTAKSQDLQRLCSQITQTITEF
jgi:hypothetical protein